MLISNIKKIVCNEKEIFLFENYHILIEKRRKLNFRKDENKSILTRHRIRGFESCHLKTLNELHMR